MKQNIKLCNTNKVKELNELTTQSIIDAFLLLLKTKRYNEISITDIANRAGVARISIYRNFQNKEEIIKRYLNSLLKINDEWDNEFITEAGLKDKLMNQFRIYYENKEILTLLKANNLSFLFYDSI